MKLLLKANLNLNYQAGPKVSVFTRVLCKNVSKGKKQVSKMNKDVILIYWGKRKTNLVKATPGCLRSVFCKLTLRISGRRSQ